MTKNERKNLANLIRAQTSLFLMVSIHIDERKMNAAIDEYNALAKEFIVGEPERKDERQAKEK